MFNPFLSLIIPISVLIWLFFSINLVRLNKISTKSFIIYFVLGLLICIGAAYRDGYGFSDSIIPIASLMSVVLSLLGLLLFIITILGSFSKNQLVKTRLFMLMIIVFISKFIMVELIMMGQLL